MRRTYKYRIYPTKAQEETLDYWLYLCRRLYNAMLEQRISEYKQRKLHGIKRSLSKYDQMRELPALKAEFPEYAQIGSHVLQDVAKRLDKSSQRFFEGAGYPKFQGRNRYDSFTFPDCKGWKLKDGKLSVTNCGLIKVRWSREIEGDIKTVTIKRKAGQWHICFLCDNVPTPMYPPTNKAVGIDLGIEALATTSDGERFENAEFLKRKLKHLRRLNRKLARKKNERSNRRKKAVRQIQRLHLKVANQRIDAHHKASTKLIKENAEIHMERISPEFMLANHKLAQAASDVGWGQFKTFLQGKAAAAGRKIVEKNPYNTSRECSGCGQIKPKKLSERWHECECGTSLHRDHNAAIVILNRPA
jgi:putative transposase